MKCYFGKKLENLVKNRYFKLQNTQFYQKSKSITDHCVEKPHT